MANYATLKAAVEAAIKTNGAQQITGQVLQTQLVNMITSLGKYFQSFGGLATPAGSFSAGDESVTFLAVEAGTYTNFGGAVLDGKTLHVLAYDGDWADVDTLIPSGAAFEAALALAIKGAQSGIAEGIADTISAGTAQEFLQRQSGGDGVNCLKRIKGKTIAWNQLFQIVYIQNFTGDSGTYTIINNDSDTYITFNGVPGHSYLLTCTAVIPSGAAASFGFPSSTKHIQDLVSGRNSWVATSEDTAILSTLVFDDVLHSASAGITLKDFILVDLTLLGLGDLTADQFRTLYPALYPYNAGVLKSNDAAALFTDGRNQWDEQWEKGSIDQTTGQNASSDSEIRSKNYIPVIAGQSYYMRGIASGSYNYIYYYDADKNYLGYDHTSSSAAGGGNPFTPIAGAAFFRFRTRDYGGTYNNDICINLSDASFNGTYEPYWQRVLALRISELTGIPEGGTEADRVTIFPNGLGGAGSALDSIYEGKARKTMKRVNLGDLSYTANNNVFRAPIADIKKSASTSSKANLICPLYMATTPIAVNSTDKSMASDEANNLIAIRDTAYSDAAAFKAAMDGVYLEYELATPIVYTDLQYADGTPFTMPTTILVDDHGTERIQAPEGATTPSAPFCCDSNYSIGVANLVKRLAALENAE